MSGHTDPIAYTYEADTHCPGCTKERFGRCGHGFFAMHHTPLPDGAGGGAGLAGDCIPCLDDEGNEVGAVFPWDEWHVHGEGDPPYVLGCGTCHGEIERCENDD